MIDKVIFWFLLVLFGFFIVSPLMAGKPGGMICAVILLPLLLVFNKRRVDMAKQDAIVQAMKNK